MMRLNEVVEPESSFCRSFFVDETESAVYVTYHNGAVYRSVFTPYRRSVWEENYTENKSVGKAFWASLIPGESVMVSKG